MALDIEKGTVELAHGSGGRAMSELIDQIILPAFKNPVLEQKNDQAVLSLPTGKIVTATDSHVISPLFFPGGDIGSLSVHGTINDVVMAGAKPYCLTVGLIIEEGFPLADLKRIVDSIAAAAALSHVQIVTGDTKVVEKGNADGIYINTTGIGVIEHTADLSPSLIQPGDRIILSGNIGDHGMTILSERQQLKVQGELRSDSQALDALVDSMLPHIRNIRCMRDPTRGGLAATLNEIAQQAQVGMLIDQEQIPLSPAVEAMCEILGMDPLYLANEGKLVAFCSPDAADQLLQIMHKHPQGANAKIIGEVLEDKQCFVEMTTEFGGKRLVDWRYSDPLPRIC